MVFSSVCRNTSAGVISKGPSPTGGLAKLDVSLAGKLLPAVLYRVSDQIRSVDRGGGGLRV